MPEKKLRFINISLILTALFLLNCGPPVSDQQSTTAQPVNSENTASANNKKSVVCFVYHRFDDDRYPSTNVSLETFKQHLQYLKSENFEVLSLSDAVSYLKDDTDVRKVAVITIDDGYQSFKNAIPVLQEYGYPTTLFINTQTVGSNSYLDWGELGKMTKAGVEIGNHTHSHAYFMNYPENERHERFKKEVELSQKVIREKLQVSPKTFAYPYGEFDDGMKQIIAELGFTSAAAQNSGVIGPNTDVFALPRFPMANGFASLESFKEKVKMKTPKLQNETPQSRIITDSNPPELKLTFSDSDFDIKRIQCFVQGGQCELKVLNKNPLTISIKGSAPLQRRRTLYTITCPSTNGPWYWYSHLWIRPEVRE